MKLVPMLNALAAVSALALGSSPALSAPPGRPWAPVDHVYVPKGFDSNDDTQVIVAGYLPDLCYKAPKAEVRVDGRTIHVSIRAILDENAVVCPQVIVPFLEAVSVGPLEKGSYDIVVNEESGGSRSAKVTVVEAPSLTVDDHIYANVDHIEKTAGSRKVRLKGYNPSDCLVFDHLEFVSNETDTYSILPIMRQVRENCPMKMVPFTIEAVVPDTLPADEILLHVRRMDGRSVNALFDGS